MRVRFCESCDGAGRGQCDCRCKEPVCRGRGTIRVRCNNGCDERGFIPCPHCGGKRFIVAKSLLIFSRKIACVRCFNGRLKCPKCKEGYIERACPRCRGRRHDTECTKCSGTGWVTCPVCAGQKKIEYELNALLKSLSILSQEDASRGGFRPTYDINTFCPMSIQVLVGKIELAEMTLGITFDRIKLRGGSLRLYWQDSSDMFDKWFETILLARVGEDSYYAKYVRSTVTVPGEDPYVTEGDLSLAEGVRAKLPSRNKLAFPKRSH